MPIKRERIECEFDDLAISNKQIKIEPVDKIKLNNLKRQREDDILSEMFIEKLEMLKMVEREKNKKMREIRLNNLHDSMYM